MRDWLGREREGADHERLEASRLAFATACFQRVSRDAGNICLAPAGLFSLLTLAQAGARGATAEEMTRVLRLPSLPSPRLHAAARVLMTGLRDAPSIDQTTALGLFVQCGHRLQPEFRRLVTDHYGGAHDGLGQEGGLLHAVDFVGSTADAHDAINGWIERDTRWRLTNVVPRGIVSARTRLLLVSALHVTGAWARRHTYRVIELDESNGQRIGHAIELPSRDGAIAMVVLLPSGASGVGGLCAVEDALPSRLGAWLRRIDAAPPQVVDVHLPRFVVRSPLRLDAALQALGMARAFDADRADFSGIGGPAGDLCLSGVLQHASVEADAHGGAASAATAITRAAGVAVVAGRSPLTVTPAIVGATPAPMPVFRVDRPFLFAIRDLRTTFIILLGRVADPTAI